MSGSATFPNNAADAVYRLSLASNIIAGECGTQMELQSDLESQLSRYLSLTSPNWQIVWGPVAWKRDDPFDERTGADNVWFVVRNFAFVFPDGKPYDTYVLAVSASVPSGNGRSNRVFDNDPCGGDGGDEGGGERVMVDLLQWCGEKGGVVKDPSHYVVSRSLRSSTSMDESSSPSFEGLIPYTLAKTIHRLATTPSSPTTPPFPPTTLQTFISQIKSTTNACRLNPHKIIISGHGLSSTFTAALAFALLNDGEDLHSLQQMRVWSRLESISPKPLTFGQHRWRNHPWKSRIHKAAWGVPEWGFSNNDGTKGSTNQHRNIVNTPLGFEPRAWTVAWEHSSTEEQSMPNPTTTTDGSEDTIDAGDSPDCILLRGWHY